MKRIIRHKELALIKVIFKVSTFWIKCQVQKKSLFEALLRRKNIMIIHCFYYNNRRRMLKGVPLQLESICNYLEKQLSGDPFELKWETYLLNTEKNTFELLKLINIVLSQLEQHLHKGTKGQFQKCCKLLKSYYKNRPKGEVEHDDYEKNYRIQYDQVQHYLDNKPQITTNEDHRSELFKFLTINQQKEKNNLMVLQCMPRYSFDFSSSPSSKSPISKQFDNYSNTLNPVILDDVKPILQIRESKQLIQKQKVSLKKQNEVQTDLTLAVIKQIIDRYANSDDQSEEKVKQKCDFATEMSDFIQQVSKNILKKRDKKKEKKQGKQIKEGSHKKIISEKQNIQNKLERQSNEDFQIQQKSKDQSSSKKNLLVEMGISPQHSYKEEPSKLTQKLKPKEGKRESNSSIKMGSKKDISKRNSIKKGVKQGKGVVLNESKFSKEKTTVNNKYSATILETSKQMVASTQQNQSKKDIEINNPDIEETSNLRISEESVNTVQLNQSFENKIIQNPHKIYEVDQVLGQNKGQRQKGFSQKEKELDNKNNLAQINPFSTISHSFYPQTYKKENKYINSSLPKIQQKGLKQIYQRVDSLNKIKYENSPYLKNNKEYGLKGSNRYGSNNISNIRSFHLNPIQSENEFGAGQINQSQNDRSFYSSNFKNCSSHRIQKNINTQFMTSGQRQRMFLEAQSRIVREMQQAVRQKKLYKQYQWAEVAKSIRHYELMHANICGENCIHLDKFYDFLKRKKLSGYLSRKQLVLHKKNIQINSKN